MAKISAKEAVDMLEMVDAETYVFFNMKTEKVDFYGDYMELDDEEYEKFEDDIWIAAPTQRDINEYDIMTNFVNSVTDPRKNELLSVALEGRGAFRRFKDTLLRVELREEWFEFKRKAFIKIAKEWCDENNIELIL